ncbi:TetR/AcrR family transcriptional regulator [Lichenicoccus sp.]|uniref:TetR/AcrR family transcriptional regulator n=1 Tax=Lichenicoccus sp. TaxID=2781899 RepID=UPI003D12E180
MRTEDRRQAIIEVALDMFREVGFERTSMTMIARRLGGSKGTLYGYFQSKEELFETAIKVAYEGRGDQIMALLDPETHDLRANLERFASAYLDFILEKDVLAITRTAVAEGASSSLGAHLFEQGPRHAMMMLVRFFADQIKRGRLRDTSPIIAALHLKGLIEVDFLEAALYGANFQIERHEAIPFAVDAFLRAYGTPSTEQDLQSGHEPDRRLADHAVHERPVNELKIS